MLYRENDLVYDIGAVCTHEGGPLDQGNIEGLCVECPWHQSAFDLRDGSVVHGPATYASSEYETRVREGKIEIRRAGLA
jgi:nitrite reductase/ring-hydroxylating ferredoxin subunit